MNLILIAINSVLSIPLYEAWRDNNVWQNLILIAMIGALLIPLYEAWRDNDIWQKMLAFASISTKTAIIILVISVFRDDWMIGVVAVLILTVGNAGLMLLAQIIKRISDNKLY